MQFKTTTDYAIRTLLYLADKKDLVTAVEIADALSIPQTYVPKILGSLKKGKFVNAFSGVKGGYSLSRQPEDINLKQVILAMETTTTISKCLEEGYDCESCPTDICPIRSVMQDMQEAMMKRLEATTIAVLLEKMHWLEKNKAQTKEVL